MAESRLSVIDLNPSVAIFPLQLAQGSTPQGVAESLHARIETLVGVEPKSGDPRKNVVKVESLRPQAIGGWVYTGAIYLLDVAPSWLERTPPGPNGGPEGLDPDGGDDIQDEDLDGEPDEDPDDPKTLFRQQIWHLALIGTAAGPGDPQALGRMVIHATQDTIAARLREFVTAGRFGQILSGDPCGVPFDDRVLQAHCLHGEARQAALWGLHRTVKSKPDRKSLMGLDLKEAMDPFSDQTYRLTSAVSIDKKRTPQFLGLSLKRQRVWSQKGKKIAELSLLLNKLFHDLEAVDLTANVEPAGLDQLGYRDLAKTSDPTAILAAANAFEAAFRPLSTLDPLPEDDDEAAKEGDIKAEKELAWFTDGQVKFGATIAGTAGFTLEVSRKDERLATLTVTPVVEIDGVALSVSSQFHVPPTHPDLELFEALIEGEGLSRRLAVWYDTGHVLVDRQVSLLEYRDVRFDAWTWRPLTVRGLAVEVTQEKPTKPSQKDPNKKVADLEAIGQQQSLFDYCLEDLPRLIPPRTAGSPLWAICDDGSGEIADFIFYAPADRRLWLVHAKGADSDAAGRQISVAAYEQVVSQARKNLRYFDGPLLARELEDRGADKPLLWRDGVRLTGAAHAQARDDICQQLRDTHFFEDRQLVVLQPHVSKISWEQARGLLSAGQDNHQSVKLYRLLSALLADLQITAQKVDAGFMAIGPETAPGPAPPPAAAVPA
jgi:hypothetical protein